jgi:hypothetical protein
MNLLRTFSRMKALETMAFHSPAQRKVPPHVATHWERARRDWIVGLTWKGPHHTLHVHGNGLLGYDWGCDWYVDDMLLQSLL